MNTLPLVSIIIPVFNAEKYLHETITSALNQTWGNKEIIIIDDGSTDNSCEIAKWFQSETVKIYHQKNLGASAARNYGLTKADGDYIQFLDADDLLSPNKIEKQLELLRNNPNFVGLCKTIHFFDGQHIDVNETKIEWYSEGSDDPVDFLIKLYGGHLMGATYGGMIQPNAWLTPKNIITKAGPWNEKLSVDDDGEYFCRVILSSKGISYSKDSINYYRKFRKPINLSSRSSEKAFESIYYSSVLKSQALLNATKNPKAKEAMSMQFWEVALTCYPKSIHIANKSIEIAKTLGKTVPKHFYKHTVFYRNISKLLGWKASAWISYLKNLYFR